MKNKKTIKQILVALGLAIGILILYAVFSGGFSQPQIQGGLTSKTGKPISGVIQGDDFTVANEKILKILGSVSDIDLNDDIFSNPLFRQLRDTHFTIPRPIRIGRPNPFASIGAELITITQQQQGVDTSTEEGVSDTSSDTPSDTFFTET